VTVSPWPYSRRQRPAHQPKHGLALALPLLAVPACADACFQLPALPQALFPGACSQQGEGAPSDPLPLLLGLPLHGLFTVTD